MRMSPLALAAMLATAACSDTTPTASPAHQPQRDSVATPTVSASIAAPASLYSGYSPRSPHWQHITTMMTDYYYAWTTTERAWAGAHYDMAMSGSGSAWRAVNPTVSHYPYSLLWTTMQPSSGSNIYTSYYADMKRWYAAHRQYSLERAFLHSRGSSGDSASRLSFTIWGSARWAINGADAGARAYDLDRMQRVSAADNGAFIDEFSTGDMGAHIGATRETTSATQYAGTFTPLLAAINGATHKRFLLNTAEYITATDRANVTASRGAHLEMFNNFESSGMIDRWKWIQTLTAAGAFVDFVSTYSTQDVLNLGSSYPRGNSATSVQRAKLWELASYYMAVGASPHLFGLQLENAWTKPYSTLWIKAQEANIGHPRAERVQKSHGTDPEGNEYYVYTRDFDRALVVLRLQQGWNTHTYGDGTAITVSLPTGERWIPLNADGTVGAAVTSIRLRNSEAAILLKASRM